MVRTFVNTKKITLQKKKEEIRDPNRVITRKDTELVIKNLPTKKDSEEIPRWWLEGGSRKHAS
jgi:hypothetical protein